MRNSEWRGDRGSGVGAWTEPLPASRDGWTPMGKAGKVNRRGAKGAKVERQAAGIRHQGAENSGRNRCPRRSTKGRGGGDEAGTRGGGEGGDCSRQLTTRENA